MKRGKVESILLIAVLALSMQTGSYSMQKIFKRKAQMLLYGSIEYGMERSRKGGGIKQKTDGKIQHGKTYDELMQWKRYQI